MNVLLHSYAHSNMPFIFVLMHCIRVMISLSISLLLFEWRERLVPSLSHIHTRPFSNLRMPLVGEYSLSYFGIIYGLQRQWSSAVLSIVYDLNCIYECTFGMNFLISQNGMCRSLVQPPQMLEIALVAFGSISQYPKWSRVVVIIRFSNSSAHFECFSLMWPTFATTRHTPHVGSFGVGVIVERIAHFAIFFFSTVWNTNDNDFPHQLPNEEVITSTWLRSVYYRS